MVWPIFKDGDIHFKNLEKSGLLFYEQTFQFLITSKYIKEYSILQRTQCLVIYLIKPFCSWIDLKTSTHLTGAYVNCCCFIINLNVYSECISFVICKSYVWLRFSVSVMIIWHNHFVTRSRYRWIILRIKDNVFSDKKKALT